MTGPYMNHRILACFLVLAMGAAAQVAAAEPPANPQFKKCIDAAAGVTASTVECIDAETKRQDALLNSNYKKALKNLSVPRQQSLLKAQRAWLAYRDAQCNFEYDPDGGTMAHVISTDCFRAMTAER